ncbi:MAG: cysteine desulfurase family protein [Eubacteriales bacterium]
MEAYLDNSATTQCYQSVATVMTQVMCEEYGNPSSLHTKGLYAERYIKEAKEIIAGQLKVKEKEIFFTSGGTESDNLALIGVAKANYRTGKHLITTRIEHPAILETMKYLESEGFHVTYLPVDRYGVISLKDLERAITRETILVSIMHVNNEIGSVQPIREAGELIKRKNPKTLFHVDDIQGYGKYRIYPHKMKIDLLSVSSHKIHGPKGVGFLYVSERVKIKPITYGGGQQKGLRSGTENVAGIAGMAEALSQMNRNFDEKVEHSYERKFQLIKGLEEIEDVTINGRKGRDSAPHIVSASFTGVRSEVLLHALEEQDIYVSAGSACAANHPTPSKTLQAMGVSNGVLESTIRFSISTFTTKEEISYTLETLYDMIPLLRKYTRR